MNIFPCFKVPPQKIILQLFDVHGFCKEYSHKSSQSSDLKGIPQKEINKAPRKELDESFAIFNEVSLSVR